MNVLGGLAALAMDPTGWDTTILVEGHGVSMEQ